MDKPPATTAWITQPADDVLDAAIAEMETPTMRVRKGEFLSAKIIQSLWNTLSPQKQAALLKKHPGIRQIVGAK